MTSKAVTSKGMKSTGSVRSSLCAFKSDQFTYHASYQSVAKKAISCLPRLAMGIQRPEDGHPAPRSAPGSFIKSPTMVRTTKSRRSTREYFSYKFQSCHLCLNSFPQLNIPIADTGFPWPHLPNSFAVSICAVRSLLSPVPWVTPSVLRMDAWVGSSSMPLLLSSTCCWYKFRVHEHWVGLQLTTSVKKINLNLRNQHKLKLPRLG